MSANLIDAVRSPARPDDWLAARLTAPMPRGAVLFHAPGAAFQAPGGGEVQLVETGRALEARGECVRPFVPWIDKLEDARLLHLFGMSPEGLALARVAKARGVPVVLSPICWYEPSAIRALTPGLAARTHATLGWLTRRILPSWPHWRRTLLQVADAVLPNSDSEAQQLVRLFGIGRAKFRVVPNGVHERFARADARLFVEQYGLRDFVLYVGRIEPRKNLLNLIRALNGSARRLVVIGRVVPGHELYEAACRVEGGERVAWIPAMDHGDPMLGSAYAAARVLVLVSWFETPGLAALEAALAGCEVVVTPLGAAPEYFGDRAVYAHPGDPRGIARAIDVAWHRKKQPDLANWVRSRYLWKHVARKTAEVYDDLAP